MRLWSLSPEYLDAKGIVALWREGLLARKVLRGETKGYKHHPQLKRFQAAPQPLVAIDAYLRGVVEAADKRGYTFDRTKIDWSAQAAMISVTTGQVEYEKEHLLKKLQARDPARIETLLKDAQPHLHPLFTLIDGPVESWEIV